MSEWKNFCLGDVAKIKYGKNQKKVQSNWGKFPIYGTGGLMGYAEKFLYDKPSVLIGRKGSISKVRFVDKPFWTVDTLFYTEINESLAVPKFLYYSLSLTDLSHYNEGTTIPSLRTETLNKLEVSLPPLETQKKIAAVLSALDDKIELNNAINKNLEEQAQAIYKNMFVDNFNPAWRSGTLSDIAEITSGKRPLKKFEKASEFAFVPIFGASSIMGYTTDILCDKKILITGRVGTHGIIQRYNKPCWVSDNAFIITSLYYEYCFQILRSVNYKNLNRGSTQPLITQTDLKKLDVILPCEKILLNFEELVGSLMRVCDKNYFENKKLGELRDLLLPRLMSGEIDVSKVEI